MGRRQRKHRSPGEGKRMTYLSSAAALITLVSALVGALVPWPAEGQVAYPTQTIKLIVPNPASGLPDTVSRIVGRRLQARLGQSKGAGNAPRRERRVDGG